MATITGREYCNRDTAFMGNCHRSPIDIVCRSTSATDCHNSELLIKTFLLIAFVWSAELSLVLWFDNLFESMSEESPFYKYSCQHRQRRRLIGLGDAIRLLWCNLFVGSECVYCGFTERHCSIQSGAAFWIYWQCKRRVNPTFNIKNRFFKVIT